MRLEGTFLRSKVARRVLLFFVLPRSSLLFLAVLYFVESNRVLVRQGHIQLLAASSAYGRTVYDRLLLADQLLRMAPAIFPARSRPRRPGAPGRTFRA